MILAITDLFLDFNHLLISRIFTARFSVYKQKAPFSSGYAYITFKPLIRFSANVRSAFLSSQ